MRYKKIIGCLLCAAMLTGNSLVAYAAPVDDVEVYDPTSQSTEVTYTAGEKEGSQTGTGTGTTESEEEKNISTQNTSISRELQAKMRQLVQEYVEGKTLIYVPGTSVVIREDVPVTKEELLRFAEIGWKYIDIPGLIATDYQVPASVPASENTNQAMAELKGEVAAGITPGGSLPFPFGAGTITLEMLQGMDTTGWAPELIEVWEKLLREFTVPTYRLDIIGGGFKDWPYLELRYKILEAYINSVSMSDTINTTNVTEYRVTKEETQKIVNKQPIGEYKWEVYDTEGNLLKTVSTYGRILRLSFNRAGTYFIKAYQKHYVTRADVISTAKLEYWAITETGQVLYKNQTEGKQYTYDRNVQEEFLQTNYIKQEVTPAMAEGNWITELDPNGNLYITEGFQTERIE